MAAVNHTVLEIKNLIIGYASKKKTVPVASTLNFELKKGSLVGLVGENGVGKSTLLRTLTKTQSKLGGHIYINGEDLSVISTQALSKALSVVLTENVSQTNLTVQELVAIGRQPYTNWIGTLTETDKQKTKAALLSVHISDLADKKCYELSDGQLQKVMLARALAQDTDIIILDEPTTHLDMYHKVSVLKLLQKLAKETHKTILFSTHEINVAIELCDDLIVMKKEKMHFGTPQQLIEQGAFSALFPSDLVSFDSENKIFKIK